MFQVVPLRPINAYATTMGVRNRLPFTVVNLRIHGWLTRALVT